MRHQLSWPFIVLAAILAAIPALVRAQAESIRIGKKGEIELAQPTHLGTTLLQPGHYEVQHTSVDGKHYVVVRQQDMPGRRHTVRFTGSEIARVRCQIVMLEKPARFSFAYWITGADGKATITEIRIFDEPVGHIIALRP
jgi:hypothetical protein